MSPKRAQALKSVVAELGGALHTAGTGFVIVRTFCPWDIDKLEASFDDWNKYLPCPAKGKAPRLDGHAVDLLLYYSASFEAWPRALEVAQSLMRKFEDGHFPWAHCFDHMYLDTASLSKTQDRYEPMMQNRDLLWVNGPNRQFEAAAQIVQRPKFRPDKALEGYEAFYLMEPDSVPWRGDWLTQLVNEISHKAPFAVLGSKYHGYKWHDFEEHLPLPLLHHINGNAIYNVSHGLTRLMLKQLEHEKAGTRCKSRFR